MKSFLWSIAFAVLPVLAIADCVNPASAAGGVYYNTDVNALQFCNGSNWFNMGMVTPSATGTACANPTAPEGSAYYNTTQNVVQFCNGDNWVVVGTSHYPSASGTACTTPTGDEGTMFFNTSVNKIQFCNGDNWVNATFLDPSAFYGILGRQFFADDGAGSGESFGYSIAASDSHLVAGAFGDDTLGTNAGAAYVFDLHSGVQLHKIMPTDGEAGDNFGISVAIDGNTIVVGSNREATGGSTAGAAYVFNATTGTQVHKLMSDDLQAGDFFGSAVAITGTKIVVGASSEDDGGSGAGAAYVFDATTGNQLYKLMASDAQANDVLGSAVAASGDLALVGAKYEDTGGNNAGAAYVFNLSTGAQVYKLMASDADIDDAFGEAVALDGNYALIGTWHEDTGATNAGAAYIFDVTTGVQVHKLMASDPDANDYFGMSVAIGQGYAMVSGYSDDDYAAGAGAVYMFDILSGVQTHKLNVSTGYLGRSVDIGGGLIPVASSGSGGLFSFD